MTTTGGWVNNLHEQRRKEFLSLPKEEQDNILARKTEHSRRSALRFFSQIHFNVDGRERWVDAIAEMPALVKDPQHVLRAALRGDVKTVSCILYVLNDFTAGWLDDYKNTDPRMYDLLSKAHQSLDSVGHYDFDMLAVAKHFKKHPELQPLVGKFPTVEQISERNAKLIGARIKRMRRSIGKTQMEIARRVGTCEKTIKNLERGKPVSSHTFLAVQETIRQANQANPNSGKSLKQKAHKP